MTIPGSFFTPCFSGPCSISGNQNRMLKAGHVGLPVPRANRGLGVADFNKGSFLLWNIIVLYMIFLPLVHL